MSALLLNYVDGGLGAAAARSGFLIVLIWLSVIDLRTRRLPDRIVLPTLVAGLVLNGFSVLTTPVDALLGAAGGYLSLHALSMLWSRRALPGVGPAFGGGDLKAAAMIGAWIGISALPAALLIAFVAGTVAILPALMTRRAGMSDKIPFGPALAFGGGVVLATGPEYVLTLLAAVDPASASMGDWLA